MNNTYSGIKYPLSMPLNLLITRPKNQAIALQELLMLNGQTNSQLFPVIDIQPLPCSETLIPTTIDIIIFISINAVQFSASMIRKIASKQTKMTMIGIGKGTQQAMLDANLDPDLGHSNTFNSESLLVYLSQYSLKNKTILIVRGQGGRESLANGLKEQGATVCYAEVYQRILPTHPKLDLLSNWRQKPHSIAIVTSNQGLDFFKLLLNQAKHDTDIDLVVMSERNKKHARLLGFQRLIKVVKQVSNQGIVDACLSYRGANSNASE